jgi:hypothetical protein
MTRNVWYMQVRYAGIFRAVKSERLQNTRLKVYGLYKRGRQWFMQNFDGKTSSKMSIWKKNTNKIGRRASSLVCDDDRSMEMTLYCICFCYCSVIVVLAVLNLLFLLPDWQKLFSHWFVTIYISACSLTFTVFIETLILLL